MFGIKFGKFDQAFNKNIKMNNKINKLWFVIL